MSNNITVIITQEEIEPEISHNLTLTMALTCLAPVLLPKLAKKKLQQKGTFGKNAIEGVKVQAHMRGSKLVDAYERKLTTKAKGINKMGKTMKPKKMAAKQPKHAVYPKVKADCKKSVQLARDLDLQYKIDYFEALRNI
jgi:hypothetical protein